MIRRHTFVLAVRLPDPQEPILLPLDRPVTLVDVLKRHPEWRRRLELTLRAKRDGRDVPDFPLLGFCENCNHEYPLTPRAKWCPRCGRWKKGRRPRKV